LGIVRIVASGDFAQTNNCGTSLAGGASCTISITFTPTATGDRSGSVTITNDTPGSQHTVSLGGTGTDFSLSSDPTSREITAGASTTYTLSVAPVSGFNQSVVLTCTKPTQLTLATCSVSPSAATPDGTNAATATITVTTTARGMGAPFGAHRPLLQPPLGRRTGLPLRMLLGALIALLATLTALLALGEGGLNLRPVRWATLGVGLMFLSLWAACGGGGGGGAPTPPQTGTAAGTYALTVTGTSSGVSRSTTLTLKVN
jgi:hypothetical protein